jgi:hypothetical protein
MHQKYKLGYYHFPCHLLENDVWFTVIDALIAVRCLRIVVHFQGGVASIRG